MDDVVISLKAELFDIIYKQSELQIEIDKLDKIKKEKLIELRSTINQDTGIPTPGPK